jgi:hypothetical protein
MERLIIIVMSVCNHIPMKPATFIILVVCLGCFQLPGSGAEKASSADMFLRLNKLKGRWYRWVNNPLPQPERGATPSFIFEGIVYDFRQVSEDAMMLIGTGLVKKLVAKIVVFEIDRKDGRISFHAYSRNYHDYDRNIGGSLESEKMPFVLDLAASTPNSMIWRSGDDKELRRILIQGEGPTLRMQWQKWSKKKQIWQPTGIVFRKDPPPRGCFPRKDSDDKSGK